MPWTIMLFRQQGCYHVLKVGFLYDCKHGVSFVNLHPFYYFAMYYVFWFFVFNFFGFFFTEKKSYSKLCSPTKVGYKRGKRKWEKIE
jgi:hypothetical protein